MTKVALDLDGVLCDPTEEFLLRVKLDFGVDLEIGEFNNVEIREILKKHNIPPSWLKFKCLDDPWFYAKAKPFEDNINTVNKWAAMGHQIFIVTGRHDPAKMPTTSWLRRFKVSHDGLYFQPIMKKGELCLELGLSCIMEDHFYEANRCAAMGIKAFVLRRPYSTPFEGRSNSPLLNFIDDLGKADDWVNGIRQDNVIAD